MSTASIGWRRQEGRWKLYGELVTHNELKGSYTWARLFNGNMICKSDSDLFYLFDYDKICTDQQYSNYGARDVRDWVTFLDEPQLRGIAFHPYWFCREINRITPMSRYHHPLPINKQQEIILGTVGWETEEVEGFLRLTSKQVFQHRLAGAYL